MRDVLARLAWAAVAAVVGIWSPRSLAEAAELRVATFRCDVTPPLGFLTYPPTFKPLEKIEHPLLAKGIVLDDGGRRYVLCAIGPGSEALLKAAIVKLLGAPPGKPLQRSVKGLKLGVSASGRYFVDQGGLASLYPGDEGIERDPRVLFVEDFETGTLEEIGARWGSVYDGKQELVQPGRWYCILVDDVEIIP